MPLFALGLWTLVADVPGWNAVWYVFAWYAWLLALDAGVFALAGRFQNWYYVFTLRNDRLQLLVSVLAFATVLPACLLHAELVAAAGLFERRRWRPLRVGRGTELTVAALGVASLVAPLV